MPKRLSFPAVSAWPIALICLAALLAFSGLSPLPFSYAVPAISLFSLIALRIRAGTWPQLDWALYAWGGALVALCALSTIWSVAPKESIERCLKVSALLLLSLPLIDIARLYPQETLKRFSALIPLAVAVAGLCSLAELAFNFPLHHLFNETPNYVTWGSLLNKNVSVFIMALPSALLICHRSGRYSISILLVLISVLLAVFTDSQASQMALVVIVLTWCGALILPVAGIPVAFGLTALILLLMPWLSPLAFDVFAANLAKKGTLASEASASMRLENWDFISRKIMENPWTGFGMDSTRSINDFQSEKIYFATSTIMHPHNIALQLWIEFGLLGVALIIGFFGFILRRLLALPAADRRVPFATFCVAMTFLMISWSIWASWLLGFMVFLGALTILALRTNNAPAISSPRP